MQLKVKKLSENAVLPQKAHAGDAGFDLTVSRITTELNEVGEVIVIYHTDLCMEIPEGYFGALFSRSSIAKKSLSQTNAVGVVDAGYRGEIVAKFRCTAPAVVPSVYNIGERFAQLVIIPVPDMEVVEADSLGESERGESGLGSTGDKAFTNDIDTSAPTATQSLPETEVETTNSEPTNEGSGEAQNSLEEAQ